MTYGTPLLSALVLGGHAPAALTLVPPDPWTGEAEAGLALLGGVYRQGGQALSLASPTGEPGAVEWQPAGASAVWVDSLQEFGWLRDLRAVGGDQARRRARGLILSWLDRFGRWDEAAWRPSITGARIANWIATHDFFCASADDEFRSRVFESLARQTRYLTRILPDQATGHDLVTALVGMALGAFCLTGHNRQLHAALVMLDRALPYLVPADGVVAERSPSIQLAVLRRLIDLRAALRAGRVTVPEAVQHAIERMAPALRFFRHGDGTLALFNGGREESASDVDAVLLQADVRGRALRSAGNAGFERMTVGRTQIVADFGAPSPAGLDAHAHAGLLSFEMSVGRDRLVVNCGAHPGASEAWRTALAATAAHSTLVLGDTNSCEIHGGGGIGRRPTHVVAERQETDGTVLVSASHNGYAPGFSYLHRRRLYLTDNGEDLRGEDVLEPVLGTSPAPHAFVIRFHLHPSVRATMEEEGDQIILIPASGQTWRLRASGGTLALADSIYFGAGDEARPSRQVTITGSVDKQGAMVKWRLRRDRAAE